jgi:3-deoxy-7-phosphoheptulonate synthase
MQNAGPVPALLFWRRALASPWLARHMRASYRRHSTKLFARRVASGYPSRPDSTTQAAAMLFQTDDVRIKEIKELLPPIAALEKFPVTEVATTTTFQARQAIHRILAGDDDRLLVVIGPCSIHDPAAALDYGRRLLAMHEELAKDLLIVMRVYFEKPRTTVGWKGLINDPHLDGSFDINNGLRIARKLLLDLNDMGVPAATEFLDMITPQYFADLISWGAIGARTTESQVHRELASGLSCPVGFKNGTDGNLKIAIDAIRAASVPHHFLSVTKFGHSAIVATGGNPDCHVILRGGKTPNYDAEHVAAAVKDLASAGLPEKVMVDFSHANSSKDFRKQITVTDDVAAQIAGGNQAIFGVMVESHIHEGRQDLVEGKSLQYGQSITDACINWSDSEAVLRKLAAAVAARRSKR